MAHQHNTASSIRPKYNPLVNIANAEPVIVEEHLDGKHIFLAKPFFGALLFENTASDARDHCMNERTFLSWLRLSMYLAIVSIAIIISFHLRGKPSEIERQMALPLGVVFWVLSLASLTNGFATYVLTVVKYSRKAALVQSGWRTQLVYSILGTVILGSCILFLITDAK